MPHQSGAQVQKDYAQTLREFEIRSWGTQNGLPIGTLESAYQTKDGYLWIGSHAGLVRFDGIKFSLYDHGNTPVLPQSPIWSLSEDNNLRFWIGTHVGPYIKEGNVFERPFPTNLPDPVRSHEFALGADGAMWAAGHKDKLPALLRFEGGRLLTEYKDPLQSGLTFESFDFDSTGRAWLGGFLSLNVVETNGLVQVDSNLPLEFKSLVPGAVRRAKSGEMWVAFHKVTPQENAFARIAGWLGCYKDGEWIRLPSLDRPEFTNYVRGIVEDSVGALWMEAPMGGMLRYKSNVFEYVPVVSTRHESGARPLNCDREGNLWLSAPNNTLIMLAPRRITSLTVNDGLVNGKVWCLYPASDGSVWIGTEGGLSRFSEQGLKNYPMPSDQPESSVRTIGQDLDGRLWFGTIRALHSIDKDSVATVKFSGEWYNSKIRSVCPSREGGLWVGTVRSLVRLRRDEQVCYTTTNGLPAEEVRVVMEARDGSVWVGTYGGGLSRFWKGQFLNFGTTNGLSSDNVMSLHEDAEGTVWVGTEHGLNRIENGSISAFLPEHGLPDRSIHCILEDDHGRLWMSCDRGVFWAHKRDFEIGHSLGMTSIICVLYDATDGLPQSETSGHTCQPAGCKSADGRLWFATPSGVVVINPNVVHLDDIAPLAVVGRVLANGKIAAGTTPEDIAQYSSTPEKAPRSRALTIDQSSVLPSPRSRLEFAPGAARLLEFQFTGNTFLAPERTCFKYRLRGLSEAWTDAGTRRQAYFADLKPGNYTFEVIAGNHHGVWQRDGDVVAFRVASFFYQTWWFYTALGFAGVASLTGLVSWRIRELRHLHSLEQHHALNEQRERIARDIHDELGASLTHIVQLSERAALASSNGSVATSEPVERIGYIAGEAVEHIRDIVWVNNPKFDTLFDLVSFLREEAAKFLEPSGIEIAFEFPLDVPALGVDGLFRRGVLLVVKEALNNALKYSGATRVTFRIVLHSTCLELCITDNGNGFNVAEPRPLGNGLENMRARVKELGGTLVIRSAPGRGTSVHFSVPLTSGAGVREISRQ